jgi:hypothetical protein
MEQAKAQAKVLVMDVFHSRVNIKTNSTTAISTEFIGNVFV